MFSGLRLVAAISLGWMTLASTLPCADVKSLVPNEQCKMGLPMALNPHSSSPASPPVAQPFLGKQIPSAQKGEALLGDSSPPLAGGGDGFAVHEAAAASVTPVARGTLPGGLLSVLLKAALHVCEQPKTKLGGTTGSADVRMQCLTTPLLGAAIPAKPSIWTGGILADAVPWLVFHRSF